MKSLAILGGKPIGKVDVPEWPIFDQREIDSITEVVKSGVWAFGGSKQRMLEAEFAKFCKTKYAIAVTNGTHTLKLALEALGIGPGDEVIVPGSTWQATAASVLDVNAIPILVDIDPGTYTIDPKKVEAAITSRTRCIIPVHIYGRVCDMDAIMNIAGKHNLYVIEDCAHQHGSEWKGRKVGSIGCIGSFSLQSSKILNTGEGGLLTTDDDKLYNLLQSLKSCGRPEHDGAPTMQSGNFRMTEFQAAIGLVQLSRLNDQNELRWENALYLESLLQNIEGIECMRSDDRITFQAYYQLTIKYKKEKWRNIHRNIFINALTAELGDNFQLMIPYEPLNNSPLYRPFSKKTHKLSDEYCKLINPERFDIPECVKAYEEQAIGFQNKLLLADKKEFDKIALAIAKLRSNIDELEEYSRRG